MSAGLEKIVVGIDLGTTMTAVAYAHLVPDTTPEVRVVNKWPGQEDVSGESKIPSVIAYRNGTPVAFGEEAIEYSEIDEGIELAKWFKLHLHPRSMTEQPSFARFARFNPSHTFEIPALPSNVSIVKVYADMFHWLLEQVAHFFKSNTMDGEVIWERLGSQLTLVIAIPNGWEIQQQQTMRSALILGRVLPQDYNPDRLEFVTEGEASVHFALHHHRNVNWLSPGTMFAIVDAGGSTVDSTLYRCKEAQPDLILEEACRSECVQAGSVFVDRAMQSHLENKLDGSRFSDPEDIARMVKRFEGSTKRRFDGRSTEYYLQIGTTRDTEPRLDISRGRLKLRKNEVEEAFSEAVNKIVASCSRLLQRGSAKHLLLVGGFGESPYLQARLRAAFGNQEIRLVTVDEATRKAAAEGAVRWYIKQLVKARAARFTLGVLVYREFDPLDPLHQARRDLVWTDLEGSRVLSGHFVPLILKDSVVSEETSVDREFHRFILNPTLSLVNWETEIFAYDGSEAPVFATDEEGQMKANFRSLCGLRADLSGLSRSLSPRMNEIYGTFYDVEFSIAIFFGTTSLKARLKWNEAGQIREGPVSILAEVTEDFDFPL